MRAQQCVVVSPPTACAAHAIDGPAQESATHSLTRPVSSTGLPSLAIPCGFAAGGLPISMELTGRPWKETTVLRLGHAFESATDWGERRAPLTAQSAPPDHTPVAALPSAISRDWVMDYARLTGLTFVSEEDAEPLAQSIDPQRTQRAHALETIDVGLEPAVRPAR